MERLPVIVEYSKNYQRLLALSTYKRLLAIKAYEPSFSKIRAEVRLYKAKTETISGLEEDFSLSEYCHRPVQIKYFDGDHVTVLHNEELAEEINRLFEEEVVFEKIPMVPFDRSSKIEIETQI